ncbi:CD2 protein, partial [Serilophus lunatus]|nr:CD2 protein [Serilophus lunatus]
WKKNGQSLVQVKNNKVKYYVKKDQCRCTILRNGTLQIEHVVREDSGNYTVTVYQQDGKLKAEEHTVFFIQGKRNHLRCACPFSSFSEPVPQPILSAKCTNKTLSVKCEVNQ